MKNNEGLLRKYEVAALQATEEREKSELLQYRIDELTQQLEQERADRTTLQGTPERAPSPRMGYPSPVSPVSYVHVDHVPEPRAVSPIRSSSRSQVVDAQIIAWKNFVSSARKFNLSERDLVLVSSSTLKQLIHHCGMGVNPIDVARIELSWRQRNEMAAEGLDYSTVSVRSCSPQAPVPRPHPTPSPYRQSPMRHSQASPMRSPSKARSRSESTRFKKSVTSSVCEEDEEGGFVVPMPRKKPSLGTRKCLANRDAARANPNIIKTTSTSPSGIRRSMSPEMNTLPPYVGGTVQSVKLRGSQVAGLSNKSSITFNDSRPSDAQPRLRPVRASPAAYANPNVMAENQNPSSRLAKARSPEPNRTAPAKTQGKRMTGNTNTSNIVFN